MKLYGAFLYMRNLTVKYLLKAYIGNIDTLYFLTPLLFFPNDGIFFWPKYEYLCHEYFCY